jgi:uncharacterized membrane protein
MAESASSDSDELVSAERLIAFADAVVAIAITLLALDLPLPRGDTSHQLWSSMGHQLDGYGAFAVSFYAIAQHWRVHHQVFRDVVRTDRWLMNGTMAWLFLTVLTPFVTRVLTGATGAGSGAWPAKLTLYALVQALTSAVFLLMTHRLAERGLLRAAAPLDRIRRSRARLWPVILTFGLSIVVVPFTSYAWICWCLTPVVQALVMRRLRRAPGQPERVAG